MSLKDLDFKLSYNSRENDLVEEFYIPCLKNAVKYERAVGFFTSGILHAISYGLDEFVANNGTMRLICSPKLEEDDIKAIEKGYKDRESVICTALLKEIEGIPNDIIDQAINCLSWLISVGRLDIKIALPERIDTGSYGIYHEKMGLFRDKDDNVVSFFGSNNETLLGVTYNYESFDVYKSWSDGDRCYEKIRHFKDLWENTAIGVKTYLFSDAAKKRIIEKIEPQERPIITKRYGSAKKKLPPKTFTDNLWYFQKEAIDKFKDNHFGGIFSMATGTGKTKTAIGAIIELKNTVNKLFAIIACPQNTIIKQWQSDIDSIELFDSSVLADGTNAKWGQELADKIIDFNEGRLDNCVVYTTYNTLSSDRFIKIASGIKKDALLVGDEVHWAGAGTFQNGLLPVFKYRLGLSATPKRYMDEEGSDVILQYFGKVVYEFSLERALNEENPSTGETFLCPYNYFPVFVALNNEELTEYYELCEKIRKQYARESDLKKRSDLFQRLCERRQAIITNTNNKYNALETLLDTTGIRKYLLVYCSPQQIDNAQDILNKHVIKNHRFTGEESTIPKVEYKNKSERDYILENFENGSYSALVAMKCLDEGINILRAENAILMASSSNPRQYVQRRGRLLRRHKDKKIVNIYDILVVPYLDRQLAENADKDERKILEKELIRYEEFASLATNKLYAINKIFEVKKIYAYYNSKKGGQNVAKRD